MRAAGFESLLVAVLAVASTAHAATLVDFTDIPLYSSLAPCARSAVKYAINSLTNTKCPEGITALQSCACTKDSNAGIVQSMISSSASYSCGSTATEDITSASKVFHQYCNQAEPVTAVTGPTLVSQYITELAAFSYLAPCASYAVSYAVQSMTYSLCPEDASALNSCACTKNQNSYVISQSINSNVKYSCGSTHTADISSAQAVFAGYCGMGNGVTSFAVGSPLAGTMTYYITDMPDYSSLARCAQNALSYGVQYQTRDICPQDPAALASCACAKDQNSQELAKSITSNVKYSCDSTATQDISSAMAVFDSYCSAAKGLITPTGVTASVTTSAIGGSTPSAKTLPPGSRVSAPTPTSTGATSGASNGGSSNGGGSNGGSSSGTGGSNAGLIGGVVGGVVGAIALGLAGFFTWFCRRKRSSKASLERLSSQVGEGEKPGGPGPVAGASDAAGTAKSPLSGGTSELEGHGQGSGAVSPLPSKDWDVKAGVAEAPGGWGVGSELHGSSSPGTQHTELQGTPGSPYGNASLHEAPTGQGPRPELQGGFEMQPYPRSPDPAAVSGPIYEMPAGYGGWEGHAR